MPLRRYIFNTLTVVSLLLMIGTVGLWVDSYFHEQSLKYGSYRQSHFHFYIASSVGRIDTHCEWGSLYGWDSSKITGGYTDTFAIGQNLNWMQELEDRYGPTILGFGGFWEDLEFTKWCGLMIPHWFLTLIFATLPAIWLYKWNKRRKLGMVGKCPSCGYDLTGNETGKCPECGVAKEISSDSS